MNIFNKNHVDISYVESELHNVEKTKKQRADFNISTENLHGAKKQTIISELKEIGCELKDAPLI